MMKPFQCTFPGCHVSYRRKEHLNRHKAEHLPTRRHACVACGRSFTRNDSLRRHVRQNHGEEYLEPSRTLQSCHQCRVAKAKCTDGSPCDRCVKRGLDCTSFDQVDDSEQVGHPPLEETETISTQKDSSLESLSSPLGSHVQEHVNTYFSDFHPHWPFLHKPTFDLNREPSLLVYSVVVIGLWSSGDDAGKRAALKLHTTLGATIHRQMDSWDFSDSQDDGTQPSSRWPIATYQGILLYIVFALVKDNNRSSPYSFKLRLAEDDYHLLDRLVKTCLNQGMFYFPRMIQNETNESITCSWIGVEELKRLGLALYKVCKLCHPGSALQYEKHSLLSLEDLQYPIPDSDYLWEAGSNPILSSRLAERAKDPPMHSSMENWISNSAELLHSSAMGFDWI